jgi:hypothetical protein
MTKFEDGPAAGTVLSLRRMPMPVFLRVVVNSKGTVDALDMPDDEPTATEKMHAYRKTKFLGNAHVCIRGKGKKGSGFYEMCEYSLCAEQPEQETMRDRAKWQAWCTAEFEKTKSQPPTE